MELRDVAFEFESGRIPLANLSLTGAGFFKTSFASWPTKGSKLHGKFRFEDGLYPAELEVMHEEGAIIGCRFTGQKDHLEKMIKHYFEIEIEAAKMVKVRSEVLKPEDDGTPHWYRSSNSCELYMVEDKGEIIRFHLSYFGNYFEYEKGGRVKAGQVVESEDREKAKYKQSSLVRWVASSAKEAGPVVERMLKNIPDLREEHRAFLQNAIESA